MSRTKRTDWKGHSIKDGEHGKRCPELNCAYCNHGERKRLFRRKLRHTIKQLIKGGRHE